jgi:serine/threonine protein phosphatase PrpC
MKNVCEGNKSINNEPQDNSSSNIEVQQHINLCYKEYSFFEDSNLKFRNTMEDFSRIVENYMGDHGKTLFSLYDGHGGSEPVLYVKERMPELFHSLIINNNPQEAMIEAFHKIDQELQNCDSENTGCTACVVYMCIEEGKRILYCANVGDTRCVVVTNEDVNTLTEDHKCTVTSEVQRVRDSGGVILNGRVFGQLILTRALGDLALKGYGVIATPHVTRVEIEEKQKYTVIASDGVWDVIKPEDMLNISKEVVNAEDFSKVIVNNSISAGSRDNISCIVIRLN